MNPNITEFSFSHKNPSVSMPGALFLYPGITSLNDPVSLYNSYPVTRNIFHVEMSPNKETKQLPPH